MHLSNQDALYSIGKNKKNHFKTLKQNAIKEVNMFIVGQGEDYLQN